VLQQDPTTHEVQLNEGGDIIAFTQGTLGIGVVLTRYHVEYKHHTDMCLKQIHSDFFPCLVSMLVVCGAPPSVSARTWTCSPNCDDNFTPKPSAKDSMMSIWLQSNAKWCDLKDMLVPMFAYVAKDKDNGERIVWMQPHYGYNAASQIQSACALSSDIDIAIFYPDGQLELQTVESEKIVNPVIEKAKMVSLIRRVLSNKWGLSEPVMEHAVEETKLFNLMRYYASNHYDVNLWFDQLIVNRVILGRKTTVIIGINGRFSYQLSDPDPKRLAALSNTHRVLFESEVRAANDWNFNTELVYQEALMLLNEEAVTTTISKASLTNELSIARQEMKRLEKSIIRAREKAKASRIEIEEAKASRLQLEEEKKALKNCTLCLVNEGRVVLRPCMHYGACLECIAKIRDKRCPYCRVPFVGCDMVFVM
jgi:hypothetical protein